MGEQGDWVIGGDKLNELMFEHGKQLVIQVIMALTEDMEKQFGFKLPTMTIPETAALLAFSDDPPDFMPKGFDDSERQFAWIAANRAREVGLVSMVGDEGVAPDPAAVAEVLLQGGIVGIRYKMLYDWPALEEARRWVREQGLENVRVLPDGGEVNHEEDKSFGDIKERVERLSTSEAKEKYEEWLAVQPPVVRDYGLKHDVSPEKLYRVLESSTLECMAPGSIVGFYAFEVVESGTRALPVFQSLRSPTGFGGSRASLEWEHVEPVTLEQLQEEIG